MSRTLDPNADYIFLSAPGDLQDLRPLIRREFREIRSLLANDHGLYLYDYVTEFSDEGFRDWLPAQVQIPIPSDANCKAVVCLLGERIGTPLPTGIDLSALGRFAPGSERGNYHLVHPWKPGAELSGGFSLTGTVFEFLAALSSNTISTSALDTIRGKPPLKLIFLGDESLSDDGDPIDSNWGWRQLLEKVSKKIARKSELGQWTYGEYRSHLHQLQNLLHFVRGLGIVPDIAKNMGELREKVRTFFEFVLEVKYSAVPVDPFKGLAAFEEWEESVFYGRSVERTHSIERLSRLLSNGNSCLFFGILGGSGVGKSSFLRAGLIPGLKNDPLLGSFHRCIVRPGDLLHGGEEKLPTGTPGTDSPLHRMLVAVLAELDFQESSTIAQSATRAGVREAAADLDKYAEDYRPQAALDSICACLDQASSSNARLLLAFDQFEEIIDQRLDTKLEKLWKPVIEFIALASTSRRIVVLYTLQMNRGDLLTTDLILGPLCALGDIQPLSFPTQSLEELIELPFRYCGILLEPALASELSRRIRLFANSLNDLDVQGSLLPLISLTLRRIYEEKGLPLLSRLQAIRKSSLSEQQQQQQSGPRLSLEECDGLLDIGSVITDLTEEAVRETKALSGPDWSEETVGALLRRLVRSRNPMDDLLSLVEADLPGFGTARLLAEALVRRRVLVSTKENRRIRLIHESVIRFWPTALGWYQGERELLKSAASIANIAEVWAAQNRVSVLLLPTHVASCAELLARWPDALATGIALQVETKDALIRDYALALLEQFPTPLERIESSTYKSAHVHLAVLYEDAELLRRYLDIDSACVHAERTDKRTPLFQACFNSGVSLVSTLIAAQASIDHPDEQGWRPLHAAATSGHLDILDLLLKHGADPSSTGGPAEYTALHLAALNGHTHLIPSLLRASDAGAEVLSSDGWTALNLACRNGHSEFALALLDRPETDPNWTIAGGWSPFLHACRFGDGALVSAMLANPRTDPTQHLEDLTTPLHLAIASGSQPIVVALLADLRVERETLNSAGRTPLEEAIFANHLVLLPFLLNRKNGVKSDHPSKSGDAPLHQAARKGNTAVADILLNFGAQRDLINGSGQSALHIASAEGHSAFIQLLLARGANPNAPDRSGASSLLLAFKAGKPVAVRTLVEGGADPDAPDWRGWTLLHTSSEDGDVTMTRVLLDAGATPSCLTAEKWSPIHLAARSGSAEIIDVLLELGLNLNAGDQHRATPLHLAALHGNHEAALRLIEWGADPFATDAFAWQPIHFAAQAGHIELVRELLARGAQASFVSEAALTPVQAAAGTGRSDVIDLLIAEGWDQYQSSEREDDILSLAIRNAHYEIALQLLAGKTPTEPDGFDLGTARDALIRRIRFNAEVEGVTSTPQLTLALRLREFGIDLPPDCLPEEHLTMDSKRYSAQRTPQDAAYGLNRFVWLKANGTLAQTVREAVSPADGIFVVGPNAQIEVSAIPWYSNVRLLRVHEEDWPKRDLYLYYLKHDDGALFRLNGTSPPIHEVNAVAPIELSSENVLDYLMFFGYFVRGEEGGFYVVESIDDPLIPRDLDPRTREVLSGTLRPAVLESKSSNGTFSCSAVVWYSNAVFYARYAVHPGGMVEMQDDEPIAADLPLRLDAPISA